MTEEEVRIVRRRLEDYPDWRSLEDKFRRKSEILKEKRIALQTPKGISYEPRLGGSGVSKESLVIASISDEKEADETAKQYARKAENVLLFIASVDDEQARDYMTRAYANGERYWDIGHDEGYTKMAVCRIISRGIASVSSDKARYCGLL